MRRISSGRRGTHRGEARLRRQIIFAFGTGKFAAKLTAQLRGRLVRPTSGRSA
jgi:hypothetical protein